MAADAELVEPGDLPDLLQRYLEAYHAHDPQTLAALYAPNAIVAIPGVRFRGRAEIAAMWEAWFTALPDAASDVLKAEGRPGHLAAEWEERGTHMGRLRISGFDLPPSGRRLRWRGATLYAWGDNGLTAVTYYFDRLDLALQLGTVRALPGMTTSSWRLLREARRRPASGAAPQPR